MAAGWERWGEQIEMLARSRGVKLVSLDDVGPWDETVLKQDFERILLCGGDGTLSHTVEQLACRDCLDAYEIAVVPLGTGNDFVRSIGLSQGSFESILTEVTENEAVPIDLVRVSQIESEQTEWIVNAATAGFGGLVASDVNDEDKERWGAMAYWFRAFANLTSLKEHRVRLELDDRKLAVDTLGLAVASGRYAGGGFPVAPEAWVNDGLLDVTVVLSMPLTEVITAGVDFTLGRHQEVERVLSLQTSRVRVLAEPVLSYSMDGEKLKSLDALFEAVPGALRMVVGKGATAIKAQDASTTAAT